MRRTVFYVCAALAASVVIAGCNKDNNENDSSNELAAPQIKITDTTVTGIIVSWDAVADAASYECVVNNDEESLIPVTETQVTVPTPEKGTYTIKVRAIPAEGGNLAVSPWSEPLTYEYKPASGSNPALEKWYGTYEVTSTKTIVIADDGTGANNIKTLMDTPQTFNITISPYTGDDSLAMFTGWSRLDPSLPGMMKLTPDGKLEVLTKTVANYFEDYLMVWSAIAELKGVTGYPDGSVEIITNADYAFRIVDDGTSITAQDFRVGNIGGGGTATMIAVEIFGYPDESLTNYVCFNLPLQIPAGDFTFTKL